MSKGRWGYWLLRQTGDQLAVMVEDLGREENAMTIPEIARILCTTPTIVRKLLQRNKVDPVQGKIYYSPLDLSYLLRHRLDDLADERATTISHPGDFVLGAHPRRANVTSYLDRLTPERLSSIERRAETLGQWLSCEETAWLLGVTKRTLCNWRKQRDAAKTSGADTARWPVHFASPPRTEWLQTPEDTEYDRILESRRDWQREQVEHVPSSRRDPVTGHAIERASGRYPPVVYDRNLLMQWVRRWVYNSKCD